MNAVMKFGFRRERACVEGASLPAEQYPLLKKESIKVTDLLQFLSE